MSHVPVQARRDDKHTSLPGHVLHPELFAEDQIKLQGQTEGREGQEELTAEAGVADKSTDRMANGTSMAITAGHWQLLARHEWKHECTTCIECRCPSVWCVWQLA